MTTHILIVDSTTFKVHLEYLFVGTGAKENRVDFNNHPKTLLHTTTENMLASMISDGCRIRQGDQIIFYLQQQFAKGIFEGQFFGIFKATGDCSFLDNNDEQQYLRKELGKSLTFRALIEPHKVYTSGVTEWEALDEIKCISSPNQMLWSLIYRKLKGNRGNTMITIYEAERLIQLIRNKNNREELLCEDRTLSFDSEVQRVVCLDEKRRAYSGRQEKINVLPRLIEKCEAGKSFESHLQAYMVKHLGAKINKSLDDALLGGAEIEWLGNEVGCGVGMQRIDIMVSTKKNEQRTLVATELKAIEANESNMTQIKRYIDWIEQYYIPNHQGDIQPVLVARQIDDKLSNSYRCLTDSINLFNEENGHRCVKLKYIEFCLKKGNLFFEVIPY